jgi:hypothetical protein
MLTPDAPRKLVDVRLHAVITLTPSTKQTCIGLTKRSVLWCYGAVVLSQRKLLRR